MYELDLLVGMAFTTPVDSWIRWATSAAGPAKTPRMMIHSFAWEQGRSRPPEEQEATGT